MLPFCGWPVGTLPSGLEHPSLLLRSSRLFFASSNAHTGVSIPASAPNSPHSLPAPQAELSASPHPCVLSTLVDLQAFTLTGQLSSSVKPKPQVYSALLDSGCQAGEHAACFSELRRNFVNTRPAKLKHLILLVKHWFRQVRPPAGTLAPGV